MFHDTDVAVTGRSEEDHDNATSIESGYFGSKNNGGNANHGDLFDIGRNAEGDGGRDLIGPDRTNVEQKNSTLHSRVPPPKDRCCVGGLSRVESKGDSTLLP